MVSKVLFSSESTEWETPDDLFEALNEEFHFTLDVCASSKNWKVPRYFAKEEDGQCVAVDGLIQDWSKDICWLNPPYGKQIGLWVEKAYRESLKGAVVVCLLPSRTDTRWMHDFVLGKAEVRFIRGRLKFGGATNSAPFPSMICVFRGVQNRKRPEGKILQIHGNFYDESSEEDFESDSEFSASLQS